MKLETLTEKEMLEISAGGMEKCLAGIALGAGAGFISGSGKTWTLGPYGVIYGGGAGALVGGVLGGTKSC
ncbi:MAG TPA: hypothetical protein DEU03_21440 [Bacillus sp. (in: Bacteria)]|uniref:Bacteriocin n=1 Tax=Bacillus thuringiensis TaxID=1428 RepID=A0A9X5RPX1_BACTU|nr:MULTISPECIES: Blp family class II bacteriocin [Bacillus cereus group]OFC88491.1 hypothetical protein BTGOE4_59520 [Bacillus thuringiensis]HCF55640.1 hypothetical protein [Bacillus sp. (in: firmicutes)]